MLEENNAGVPLGGTAGDGWVVCDASGAMPVMDAGPLTPVVALPSGYGLLPITLSVAQVATWTGLHRERVKHQALLIHLSVENGRVSW